MKATGMDTDSYNMTLEVPQAMTDSLVGSFLFVGHPDMQGVLKFWTKLGRVHCLSFFFLSVFYSPVDKNKDMSKLRQFQKYRDESQKPLPQLVLSNISAFFCLIPLLQLELWGAHVALAWISYALPFPRLFHLS